MTKTDRPVVKASLFAKAMLPFGVPIVVTLVLLALVGEAWPRSLAPGSSLKLAGFAATAITAVAAWRYAVAGTDDARVGKMAALLCLVTGLMGWPVWSTGVMPSINGLKLDPPRAVRMTFDRIELTHQAKTTTKFHWAWLESGSGDPILPSGRYFIAEDHYERWAATPPATVTVRVSRGVLGALVVTGYE
ncbi:MAG: hypothetical protein RL339_97 [Pseudomonadota bacterium]|jgi:hypothetical protein